MTHMCFLSVFAASFVALAQTMWYRTSMKWYLPFWVSFSPVSFLLMETVTTQNQSFRRLFKLKPVECWLWNLQNVGCVIFFLIYSIYLYKKFSQSWVGKMVQNQPCEQLLIQVELYWSVTKPTLKQHDCFQSVYREWPSPSSMTETLSGLIKCNLKKKNSPKTVDLPCFLFCVVVFI